MKYKISIYLNSIYKSKHDSLSLIYFIFSKKLLLKYTSTMSIYNDLMKTSPIYSKVIENLFKETSFTT